MDDRAIELQALDLERVCSDASAEPIKLTYGLLRFVTKNFSNEIGRGGFGVVYMGTLRDGRVAVKKLSDLRTSDKQFLGEIECLKKVKHTNIVRFLGYCSETQGEVVECDGANVMAESRERLLCFEYVPNGNIHPHHYLEEKPKGDEWKIRYQIIKGICQGLQYLHEKRIGHLDLKPENVMLDACMEPKITDFGLSRCLAQGESKVYTTVIRGTLGYIAPEVLKNGEISFKSDIYALGNIIKILTGCKNIDLENWDSQRALGLGMDIKQVRCCDLIVSCTQIHQDDRPTIGEIICKLEKMESMFQESTNDTGTSTNQVSHMAPPSTELLDVYPLELSFPFEAKQQDELQCKVSLINKTDGEVGFFVIPNLGGRIMPGNGILMPRSTSVFTLTMSMSRKGEPPLGSPEVLILMFIMRSSDDVRQLMKKLADEDGKLNKPTNDLYKQVKQLGGEIHRTALTAAVHRDTRPPLAIFMCSNCVTESTHGRTNRIMSIDAHPTEPWILVLALLEVYYEVYIWNWQTNQKIDLNICHPCSVSFISRKQWFVIGTKQSIHVYECPTLDQINEVMKFRVQDSESSVHDSESSDCYTMLAVHPSHPFVMSYGQGTNSIATMKLWNWEQNWSCTRIFDITSLVLQVVFNTKDTNTFATLIKQDRGVNSVKIWNFGCSMPIATMSEVLEGTKLTSVFTDGADQHMIAVIGGYCAKIWDLHKEQRVHTLSIHGGDIVAVAFHPKHPVLVTGSSRGTIRVWDCNTYRLKKTYVTDRWCRRRLQDLAFLESGRLVVHCDKEVGIMDVDVD